MAPLSNTGLKRHSPCKKMQGLRPFKPALTMLLHKELLYVNYQTCLFALAGYVFNPGISAFNTCPSTPRGSPQTSSKKGKGG